MDETLQWQWVSGQYWREHWFRQMRTLVEPRDSPQGQAAGEQENQQGND